jgi:hypothetical protein
MNGGAAELEAGGERDEDGLVHGRFDLDALLVALVLVPRSYPRNRFFTMYRWPPARRVRRRAARLRSLIADLCDAAEAVEIERGLRGMRLRYRLKDMDARRETMLSEQELALVKLGVERASGAIAPGGLHEALGEVDPAATARLAPLLRRLYDGSTG